MKNYTVDRGPGVQKGVLKACAAIVAAGVVLAAGCGKPREGITLAGSTAFQPFAEKLADQYMSTHRELSITIQGGGSSLGIQSALSGASQIGMADLVKLPPEADTLKSIVVARDGIVVVLNPANPVAGLTLEQVRGLFSGTIRNWKEVGGADHEVAVISREAGSGTRTSFEQIIGGVSLSADALIQDSNGTIRETVANDANAIGYLSHGLINEKIKPVPVDGFSCTEQDILSGNYKLVRPIFLVYKETLSPAGQAFLDYLLSAEAQKLIHANGLIPAK
jgi:phosphate transport system substrate-binding protein